jgi:hypothetical protein
MDNYSFQICQRAYRPSAYVHLLRCSLVRAFLCGRASESTIICLIIPRSATGIVTTFDICRFQGVPALAHTILRKPWVFAINKTIIITVAQPGMVLQKQTVTLFIFFYLLFT